MKRRPTVSNADFIAMFRAAGGAAEMAKQTGMSERGILNRRRAVENQEGIILAAYDPTHQDVARGGYERDFPDFQDIKVEEGMVFVFSDSHLIPGYRTTAHRALLEMLPVYKPAAVIDNGDLMDFPYIARHQRIGHDKSPMVAKEIEWAKRVLDEIKGKAPGALTRRNQGNHDMRFDGIISNSLWQMDKVPGTALADHFPSWPVAWATKINGLELVVKHRWKSGLHGPFNNALWAGCSFATGHDHNQRVYNITDLHGDRYGVDVGTMASIYGPQFRYAEANPRNWRSGFSVFTFRNGKLLPPELLTVLDEQAGTVYFRGQVMHV
jgi:hypothetical protein